MSTGTRGDEQRFTAAEVIGDKAATGSYVYVWKTLGFGGETFPLVYARPASFVSRTAQALLDPKTAKLQLYVDGPVLAMVGSKQWALAEGSIPILWWLVLGLSLSWRNGSFTDSGTSGHDWIGVHYDFCVDGPTMELPRLYLEHALEHLSPLCATHGSVGVKLVHTALGKAACIGYIAPDATPCVSSLWAGYNAGCKQAEDEKEGASMHHLPTRRFSSAAKWFCLLLSEALAQKDFAALALKRAMGNNRDKLKRANLTTISFDAAPWGGGGILLENGVPIKYT